MGVAVPGRRPAFPGLCLRPASEHTPEAAVPLQKKAPPPPPVLLPKAPQAATAEPGGPPRASVNMFSRKAGNKAKSEGRLVWIVHVPCRRTRVL